MPTASDDRPAADPRAPSRENNFDFLRLICAVLVILSHAYPLITGRQSAEFLSRWSGGQLSLGTVAVFVFFLISGFLITQSWDRCRDTREYFRRRVCRIYPGFMVAFFLSAAVVLPLSAAKPALCFSHDEVTRMTVQGICLNELISESAFPANPYPHTVNGSLWTIRHEFWCYVIVAGLGIAGLLKSRRFLLFAFACTWALNIVMSVCNIPSPWSGLFGVFLGNWQRWPGLLAYFLAGAVAYRFGDRIRYTNSLALFAGGLLAMTLILGRGFAVVWPPALSYLVLWFAFHKEIRLYDIARRLGGDYSYGIYLYAFPIQQLLVLYSRNSLSPLCHFLVAAPLTVAAGVASWHLVEKHFLKRTARPRQTMTPLFAAAIPVH